jgi:hypothetical protein
VPLRVDAVFPTMVTVSDDSRVRLIESIGCQARNSMTHESGLPKVVKWLPKSATRIKKSLRPLFVTISG